MMDSIVEIRGTKRSFGGICIEIPPYWCGPLPRWEPSIAEYMDHLDDLNGCFTCGKELQTLDELGRSYVLHAMQRHIRLSRFCSDSCRGRYYTVCDHPRYYDALVLAA